jgi:hypothetical protein
MAVSQCKVVNTALVLFLGNRETLEVGPLFGAVSPEF